MIDPKDSKKAYKERIKTRLLAEPGSDWAIEYRAKRTAEQKNWYDKNPGKKKAHDKTYGEANRERLNILARQRKAASKAAKGFVAKTSKTEEERREYVRQWYRDNREHVNLRQRKRRQEDPGFRALCNLRKRLSFLVRKSATSKTAQTLDLLGCSLADLVAHLESGFQDEMSWDTYGAWHIDHIQPCASFDLTEPAQQRQCFHFSNLQPLWALDNRQKSDKLTNAAGSREGDGVYRKRRSLTSIRSRIRFRV